MRGESLNMHPFSAQINGKSESKTLNRHLKIEQGTCIDRYMNSSSSMFFGGGRLSYDSMIALVILIVVNNVKYSNVDKTNAYM